MGRKGVSKRKSSKTKTPVVSSKSTNGVASGLSKISAAFTPVPLVKKDDAITIGKSIQKKASSVFMKNDKKR